MRTVLTQAQLTAILNKHFDGINFLQYWDGDDGRLQVVVDHPYPVEIPDASDWE